MSITSIACWDSIIIIWGHSCVAIFFGYNANLDTFLTNDSSNGLPLETSEDLSFRSKKQFIFCMCMERYAT